MGWETAVQIRTLGSQIYTILVLESWEPWSCNFRFGNMEELEEADQ